MELFPFPVLRRSVPIFITNFAWTLDGVVNFNLAGQSEEAQTSNSNEEDRFIMGLPRASADAGVLGSGTLPAAGPQGLLASVVENLKGYTERAQFESEGRLFRLPSVAPNNLAYSDNQHSGRRNYVPLRTILLPNQSVHLIVGG